MHSVISHHFIGGVYAKHMVVPEGHQVVSHTHEFDHMSLLATGAVIIDRDGEITTHIAPEVIEIKAGVQHSIESVDGYGPVNWFCIHATDCTDESQVDDVLITSKRELHMKPVMLPLGNDLKPDLFELFKKLQTEVANYPIELWNEYDMRTSLYADSPHREVSDIWLRYRDWSEFDPGHPERFADEHEPVNYPSNLYLPSAMPLVYWIIDECYPGAELGGVLITKIPPGSKVYPHSDAGAWHSEYYDKKILVVIQSAPRQTFNFEHGESHEAMPGDVFEFDNRFTHWVDNDSGIDRISLIFAIRSD